MPEKPTEWITPPRAFSALLLAVIIWIIPAIITRPKYTANTSFQAVQDIGGISPVYAGANYDKCSPKCQIKVCIRWIPGPSTECPRPGPGGGCCTDYETQCDPECEDEPEFLPPSIYGNLDCSQSGNNGWCIENLSIDFLASDPQGLTLLISGNVDETAFACPNGDTTCTVPLTSEGSGTVSYKATSITGLSDSDSKGYKLDLTTPQVDGSLNGVIGDNGWYVSDVTVLGFASDTASGILSFEYSLNEGSWAPFPGSLNLLDGNYDLNLRAYDYAGYLTETTQMFKVDTITPDLTISLDGTPGSNGWYSSSVQILAAAGDAGSGVAQIGVSKDGAVYVPYTAPIVFGDGHHTYQFKATDNAGNFTESVLQEIQVDATFPAISMTDESSLGDTVYFSVQDDGSGLAVMRVVIEDEDERFDKVVWKEALSGNKFEDEVVWDGRFKDGTQAPAGTYYVTVKATDRAGNEAMKTGSITVEFFSFLQDPSVLLRAGIPLFNPPADSTGPPSTGQAPSISDNSTTSTTGFGGTSNLQGSAFATMTTFAVGGLANTSTLPITNSNIVWGAAAAAAIGAFAAQIEEWKRRQEELKRAQRIASVRRHNAIARAYQASLDNFKATLIANGISEEQASVLKSQAIVNGSITSMLGAATSAVTQAKSVKEEEEARQEAYQEWREGEWDSSVAEAWLAQQAENAEDKTNDTFINAAVGGGGISSTLWQQTWDWYRSQLTKPESFGYLRKLNPPSWLSVSGGPSLEIDLFSEKYIGIVNNNHTVLEEIPALLFYEEQNLKISNTIKGTRNPNGVLDIDVTNGELTLSVGNYEIFANPFNATIGVTIKTPNIDNPNMYTEDTFCHDYDFNWGWMTNSFVTAHSDVFIDTKQSNEDFLVERRETFEGEIHTVKTTGIMLTTGVVVGVILFVGTWLGGVSVLDGILVGA